MLTRKQHELLCYIDDVNRDTGCCPSFEEMKEAMGLRSKSGIHRLVDAMVERGYLSRLPNRARALEVLRPPVRRASGTAPEGFSCAGIVRLPVLDVVVGGLRLWKQGPDAEVEVPEALLGEGTHFAVRATGDQMVDDGILDGDVAIIRQDVLPRQAQLSLVVVGNGRHMLRRWNREGGMIRLDPGNRAYDPVRADPSMVHVHGVVAGMVRTYL